ncbi:GFA family protein [Chitinimonas sp.]|uniref:GFA family protein n=1 Tax=Chitinimonas sp. TaxID=1934313 RepID=UPI0035B295D8
MSIAATLPEAEAVDGGCACGALRYRMQRQPLFVHCCHCTRCQRETGGPFAHHAVLERKALLILCGQPERALVPTDSGRKHWVFRCPLCHGAMWNEHGSRSPVLCYIRVGTLDQPAQFPPQAHIYCRSRQPWVTLDPAIPTFSAYYDAAKIWPAESLARYAAARNL